MLAPEIHLLILQRSQPPILKQQEITKLHYNLKLIHCTSEDEGQVKE